MKKIRYTEEFTGFAKIEKVVKKMNVSAGRVYCPKSWTGKKVAIILLEKL